MPTTSLIETTEVDGEITRMEIERPTELIWGAYQESQYEHPDDEEATVHNYCAVGWLCHTVLDQKPDELGVFFVGAPAWDKLLEVLELKEEDLCELLDASDAHGSHSEYNVARVSALDTFVERHPFLEYMGA